ncbi:MAG: hypothetical protein CME21_21405 [Gemmatimonadetes bacterium]|nr:hypothetical protein [Gemmatimonadota bacterium]
MGRGNGQPLSGAFNPGRESSSISLEGAFNPGRTTSQLENGGRSVRSMMDMASEYAARRAAMSPAVNTKSAEPEYSMPDADQDAFLRAQYESTGFIPQGGFESLYQDPDSLRSVQFMDTVHNVPRSWSSPYLPQNVRRASERQRFSGRGTGRAGTTIEGFRVGDDPDSEFYGPGTETYRHVSNLLSGGTAFGADQNLPAFTSRYGYQDFERGNIVNPSGGFRGASVGDAPTWRMKHGGLVPSPMKDYRGGGLVKTGMPRYQTGGIVDAPMAMESMAMEESMPAGLAAAPAAMGMEETSEVFPGMPNEMLAQVAASMPPEQIEMVKEEVKMALMGRHPQGEQLLAVVEIMFPGMIEEVAVSLQGSADGMTDSELALLAPGEYVMDARSVSDLGNGSTEAGGQVMDRMVQEIRMANTGSPAQPPAMDPMAFMPPEGMA